MYAPEDRLQTGYLPPVVHAEAVPLEERGWPPEDAAQEPMLWPVCHFSSANGFVSLLRLSLPGGWGGVGGPTLLFTAQHTLRRCHSRSLAWQDCKSLAELPWLEAPRGGHVCLYSSASALCAAALTSGGGGGRGARWTGRCYQAMPCATVALQWRPWPVMRDRGVLELR